MSHALKFAKGATLGPGPPRPSMLAEGSWSARLGSFRHFLTRLNT